MNTYEYSEKDVGRGWRPVVKKAINEIKAKGGSIQQVKEKFGDLRLYVHGPDGVQEIADAAERECAGLCENCGKPGKRGGKSWIKTLCEKCPRVEYAGD